MTANHWAPAGWDHERPTSPYSVRVVHDHTPPVLCLRWTPDDRNLCHLSRGHRGSCLPLPIPWPRVDITRENPRYRRSA